MARARNEDATGPERAPRKRPTHTGGVKGAKKASKLLRDLRWVYQQEKDQRPARMSAGRERLWDLYESDAAGFFTMYERMESKLAASKDRAALLRQKAGETAKGELDRGEEKILTLIENLKREMAQ